MLTREPHAANSSIGGSKITMSEIANNVRLHKALIGQSVAIIWVVLGFVMFTSLPLWQIGMISTAGTLFGALVVLHE